MTALGHNSRDTEASIANSRFDSQRTEMAAASEQQVCRFCPPDPKMNIPLFGDIFKLWHVWLNPYPYNFHDIDYMLVPKRHMINACEMAGDELAELATIYRMIDEHVKQRVFAKSGSVPEEVSINYVMRTGPFEGTAGTIRHLHIQGHVTDNTGPMFATFYKDRHGLMEGFIMVVSAHGLIAKRGKTEAFEELAKNAANYLASVSIDALTRLNIEKPKWWPKRKP